MDAERQQLLAFGHRELSRKFGRSGRAYARAKALHTTSLFTLGHNSAFQLPPMKSLGCNIYSRAAHTHAGATKRPGGK